MAFRLAFVCMATLAALARGAGNECPAALAIINLPLVNEGTATVPDFVDVPETLDGKNWRYLGSGFQGDVYRVTPAKGEPYIHKQYEALDGSIDSAGNLAQFRSDVAVFEALAGVPTNGERFHAARLLEHSVDESFMRFADVRGQQVQMVVTRLREAGLSEAAEQIVTAYNARVRTFTADLVDRGWVLTPDPAVENGFHRAIFRRGTALLHLVPQNVVVDVSTMRMTIIDPG